MQLTPGINVLSLHDGNPVLHDAVMLAISHSNSSGLAPPHPISNHSQGAVPENTSLEKPAPSRGVAGVLMALGILSNIVALCILAKAYKLQRRRSKATFLLYASALLLTDLFGHVILGALVLQMEPRERDDAEAASDLICQFMGGSMVFFGLCPLFLGCAMAAERCLGVTQPLLHSSLVTTRRTKLSLSLIWLLALAVALLPCFQLGSYTYQFPGTWCFINVLNGTAQRNAEFGTLFSALGLASLAGALVFNTVSGLSLVLARLRRKGSLHRSGKSHDIEMVVQLMGIMVSSCLCWSPLLISGLMAVMRPSIDGNDLTTHQRKMLMFLHVAALNQILDPWVYILLRRAVFRKIYLIIKRQPDQKGSVLRRWEASSFHSSERKAVNRI